MHLYLTAAEAAQALDIPTRTVRHQVATGRLPALRLGRIIRIEASAVHTEAPEEFPLEGLKVVALATLAEWLRIHPDTLVAHRKTLGLFRYHGRWAITAAQLYRFVNSNTGNESE